MKDWNPYRHMVVGLDIKAPTIDGTYRQVINFDNAATTPPIRPVLDAINQFSPWYASVHRGAGYKSELTSTLYEEARRRIAHFVSADPEKSTVIFVKNATEGLNKIAYRLLNYYHDAVVLSSSMEHHSNDLPWRNKYSVDYVKIDALGQLDLKDLEDKLSSYNGRVKIVTLTAASNVTGFINPLKEIARITHRYQAKLVVDGSQYVPHMPIVMTPSCPLEHIDFLVFSAHKMYAPFGTGVVIGPKAFFMKGDPEIVGGGTVKVVTKDHVIWDEPPYSEEAGTPNLMGVVALDAAIKALDKISMAHILKHEKLLTNYTLLRLKELSDIIIYGNTNNSQNRVGIISFNIKGLPHAIVAKALSDEAAISVRNGCFCAQPYIQQLLNVSNEQLNHFLQHPNKPHHGLVRVSYGFYNTLEEINVFINTLQRICKNKDFYLQKYAH